MSDNACILEDGVDEDEVLRILHLMEPVSGEQRSAYQCRDCGKVFGRRFIPYGLGEGLTVNPCLCSLTQSTPRSRLLGFIVDR